MIKKIFKNILCFIGFSSLLALTVAFFSEEEININKYI